MTGTAVAEMTPDRWTMIQRMAQAFCRSDLVPETMKDSVGNCTVALLMAEQMHENPLIVMQSIYFVKGRPGWAAAYMIARANNSGKLIGPLRWRTQGDGDHMAVTCYGRLREAPADDNVIEVTVTYQMAVADGWTRNEKYKTIREQMLVWRSATWLIRRYMPEVMFGLPTVDELEDTMKDITPPPPRLDDFKPGASVASPHEEEPADAPEKVAADTQAKRIRREIDRAHFIEQLNATALFGPSAADDERLIRAQAGGEAVWADLVKRDADKRLELAESTE